MADKKQPPGTIQLSLGGDWYYGEYIISSTWRRLYVQPITSERVDMTLARRRGRDVSQFVDSPLPHMQAIWTALLRSGMFGNAEFRHAGIFTVWAPEGSGVCPIEQILTVEARKYLSRPYGIELTSGPSSYKQQGPDRP